MAVEMIRMRPPRIAVFYLALGWAVHHLSPGDTVLFMPYRLLGTSALLLGFAIMMLAWWLFRQAKTPVCQTPTAKALVTSGPFRFSRNPMYLGMLLMLTGCAFFMGTLPAAFIPFAFFVTIDGIFIPNEEKNLDRQFGQQYAAYKQRVRKWV